MKKLIIIFWLISLTSCSDDKQKVRSDLSNLNIQLTEDFEILKYETFGGIGEYGQIFDIQLHETDAQKIKDKIKNHPTYPDREAQYSDQDYEVIGRVTKEKSLHIFTLTKIKANHEMFYQIWIDTTTNRLHYVQTEN